MGAVKFSKQSVRPNPLEIDYWIDISDDPAGGRIKYFNGYAWVDLVSANGNVVNLNGYYDKVQTNKMLADKASVEQLESKVDKTEIATLIKNISFIESDETGVQMILLKYDNTTVGVTLPTVSSTSSGIVTAETFQDLVKQYQLLELYSEMYDKLAEIREQYQEKLIAGKNVSIDESTNVISVDVESAVNSATTELNEKIDIETQRAIAVETRIENRVDQHYSETDSTLALKADKSDTYTKALVDAKLSGIYKVKGSVTFENLPTTGNVPGDAYNITNVFTLDGVSYPSGTNVVYTDSGWDVLSGTFDTVKLEEDIQTVADDLAKETLRAIEAETYNSNSIIDLTNTTADLSTKLNTLTGNVYTKTEINSIVDDYLPLSGGTLTGILKLNYSSAQLSYIKQLNTKAVEGTGTWAATLVTSANPDDTNLCHIGTYGTDGVLTYMYLGLYTYNGNNLRIYSDKLTFGSETIAYLTSNVASATKLATSRTIWGQSFDGTADITGNLQLPNNIKIKALDSSGSECTLMYLNQSNIFSIGYGVATAGYTTKISGNSIQFCYGTWATVGMTFNSSGNLTIGDTDLASTNYKLYVAGNIIATGTITQESQRDLKDIIDEKVLSLDDMSIIKPTRFKWKDGRDDNIHYGGIAEDIQQVIPEVVHKSGNNLTVEYSTAAFAMVASLVEHVKELVQRVTTLEKENVELKNKINSI